MYLLCREGATVREVPIALPRRNFGNSKMSMNDIVGSLRMLAAIYARSLAGGKRKLGS